jgi:ribonuclease R
MRHAEARPRRARPLELDLPERKILLEAGRHGRPRHRAERLDAHKLIEEFMIQANVAAAETLEQKKQALVYRVHDAPSLAKQESLREFLARSACRCARPQLRPTSSTRSSTRVRGADNERWSTRWCCARRARRSTAPKTSAISA